MPGHSPAEQLCVGQSGLNHPGHSPVEREKRIDDNNDGIKKIKA